MLVVRVGSAGRAERSRSTRGRSPDSAATPTARSSSTTSRCRAATRRSSASGERLRRARRRLAQRHLRQPGADRARPRSSTATSCRSASSGSCSSTARTRADGGATTVSSRTPYLSIGEVLGLLHDEFPDVTISKIRFLESQGLIDPERTPSGYRKFYDGDVERLRFILREQKEHFLPLKVIKDRLERATRRRRRTPTSRRRRCQRRRPERVGAAERTPPERCRPDPTARPADAAPPRPVGRPGIAQRLPVVGCPSGPSAGSAAPAARSRGAPRPAPASPPTRCAAAERASTLRAARRAGVVRPRRADVVGGDERVLRRRRPRRRQAAAGFLPLRRRGPPPAACEDAADREAGLFEQLIMPLLQAAQPAGPGPGAHERSRTSADSAREPARGRSCASLAPARTSTR